MSRTDMWRLWGVLSLSALSAILSPPIPAAAQDVEPGWDACVRDAAARAMFGADDLLIAYLGHAAHGDTPPISVDQLRAWIQRRFEVPELRGARRDRAQGRSRLRRWSIRIRERRSGTRAALTFEYPGECPTTARHVIWYDGDGRLVRARSVVESCEYVDSAVHEDELEYDDAGRVTSLRRSSYTHPAHVEGMEDRRLGADLTLDDGTLPPRESFACVLNDEGTGTSLRCTREGDTRAFVDASCPARAASSAAQR